MNNCDTDTCYKIQWNIVELREPKEMLDMCRHKAMHLVDHHCNEGSSPRFTPFWGCETGSAVKDLQAESQRLNPKGLGDSPVRTSFRQFPSLVIFRSYERSIPMIPYGAQVCNIAKQHDDHETIELCSIAFKNSLIASTRTMYKF
jgi:hypothetical protein